MEFHSVTFKYTATDHPLHVIGNLVFLASFELITRTPRGYACISCEVVHYSRVDPQQGFIPRSPQPVKDTPILTLAVNSMSLWCYHATPAGQLGSSPAGRRHRQQPALSYISGNYYDPGQRILLCRRIVPSWDSVKLIQVD